MKRVFILPAPRTLSNYSSDFPSERGLSNRIISELKQKIDIDKLKDQERYFSLIIVDMKVYPSYSRSKVDCDNEEESRSYLSESWVMVLMVQGLMTILKHVLAYFPCYQMEPNVRFKLIQDSIELLENNGFKILNVICDCSEVYQNVVNLSTDSEIGYAVSFKQRNPFTAQNDRRDIFYIYDPTQLIKLVRNSLYNSGANNFTFFLQKNGKFILWPHIREVFKKDKDSSVRLCPKLTENHIKLTSPYSSQVNLAVQVLSNSVAIAIEMLMGDETTETAKFIRYFNRFFDMLNSKNCSTNKPLDRNFDLDSYTTLDDWRFKWLEEEFLGYLLEWQKETLEADVLPLEKMKMFFTDDILHPIITTVYSIKESVKFLLSKGAISVATEMFNRDVVEERYGRFYRCDNS